MQYSRENQNNDLGPQGPSDNYGIQQGYPGKAQSRQNQQDLAYQQQQQMGSRRFQSQDMDNYALKFPSGEKDFIFGNKKHYSINEGEINRFNMLKNPFEKDPAKAISQYYPRNLATDDIEGAIPGSLGSKVVKNKKLAQRLKDMNSQSDRQYEDALDRFQHQYSNNQQGNDYQQSNRQDQQLQEEGPRGENRYQKLNQELNSDPDYQIKPEEQKPPIQQDYQQLQQAPYLQEQIQKNKTPGSGNRSQSLGKPPVNAEAELAQYQQYIQQEKQQAQLQNQSQQQLIQQQPQKQSQQQLYQDPYQFQAGNNQNQVLQNKSTIPYPTSNPNQFKDNKSAVLDNPYLQHYQQQSDKLNSQRYPNKATDNKPSFVNSSKYLLEHNYPTIPDPTINIMKKVGEYQEQKIGVNQLLTNINGYAQPARKVRLNPTFMSFAGKELGNISNLIQDYQQGSNQYNNQQYQRQTPVPQQQQQQDKYINIQQQQQQPSSINQYNPQSEINNNQYMQDNYKQQSKQQSVQQHQKSIHQEYVPQYQEEQDQYQQQQPSIEMNKRKQALPLLQDIEQQQQQQQQDDKYQKLKNQYANEANKLDQQLQYNQQEQYQDQDKFSYQKDIPNYNNRGGQGSRLGQQGQIQKQNQNDNFNQPMLAGKGNLYSEYPKNHYMMQNNQNQQEKESQYYGSKALKNLSNLKLM